ncbi:MAG: dienelactone hydrolase family protein [Actinomycetes bacterium]
MATLAHEGTYSILYQSWPIPIGTAHRTGYIARPDAHGRFPVVIVASGLGGLTSFEKDVCRQLARVGIAAVAFDPYASRTGDALADYNLLSDTEALSDLDEVYEFVMSDDVAWNAGEKVGLLGFDVGGRFALAKAARSSWVGSLVVVSTPLTGDEHREVQVADHLAHLPIPVLGLYGAEDPLIDSSTVDEAQNRNAHGQWLLYAGAKHSFCDPDSDDYDAGAAADAMARIKAFFAATLPPAEVQDLG